MAACDHQDESRPPNQTSKRLSGNALLDRLEEEINRAARQGVALSCLLLCLDARREMERAHGQRLMS
ncbi:MAG: hypothetical protein ACRDK2_03380, partial [Solirubrobacteraceae bacterium]